MNHNNTIQIQNGNKMAERKRKEPKLEMASSASSIRCILGSVVPLAPPKLLVSVLADKISHAQLKELIEEKRRRETGTSPFDRLPDELVLKIIDMTAWSVSEDDDGK